MRHVATALICGIFLLALQSVDAMAAGQDGKRAAAFVTRLGERVLATLEDKTLSRQDRAQYFYGLFRESFNTKRICAFSLGRYRHSIGLEQATSYRDLFSKYMAGLYASKFADYSGETFVVTAARSTSENENEVSAEIRKKQGSPTHLVFKIDQVNGDMKIYDVAIEGVSLLFTKRQEVTSVIARDGIDPLLDRLREAVQLAELR